MYKIVIDANVLVSSLLDFGGYPEQSIEIALKNIICINELIEKEYLLLPEKLNKKVKYFNYRLFISGLKSFLAGCKKYPVINKINICRDPKDNCYLNTCLSAKVDYLITGDKDLLDLTKEKLKSAGLPKLKILSPRKFVELFYI